MSVLFVRSFVVFATRDDTPGSVSELEALKVTDADFVAASDRHHNQSRSRTASTARRYMRCGPPRISSSLINCTGSLLPAGMS